MKKIKKKILALPIELYQREFYSSLYMALVAAQKGYQVIIGEQNQVVFKRVKRGIYYHKDHANWSYPIFRKAVKRKMKIATLDVEGLIYDSEEIYVNNRVSKTATKLIDIIFAWGDNQRRLIEKNIDDPQKIFVVGSPKFDISNLIKDKLKKEINTNKYVHKILINTRFPSINGIRGNKEIDNIKHLGILKNSAEIEKYKSFIESERIIFTEFEKLLFYLSESESFEVTIRPHPAENENYYNSFKKYKNLTIDKSTELNKQILSHDCVIHDGCTTAIEARALGKPVFGLRPEHLVNAYNNYANQFSQNFFSAKELFDYLSSETIGNFKMPDCDTIANKSIRNWGSNEYNATVKMINIFDNLNIEEQKIIKPSKYKYIDFKKILYNLFSKSKYFNHFARILFGHRIDQFILSMRLSNKKFASLDYDLVKKQIQEINHLDSKNTVPLNSLKLIPISDKSFIIYKI